MDRCGELQEARSRMLAALDEYLRRDQSDKTEFDSRFDASQQAHAHYATTLREYMNQKYSHLKEQAGRIGLPT
ncbi:MAG TPA: hypothetical protein VMZ30_22280 [Pyrinomonadaceae bacterium]|nr:hypothetical protein [Pyrinomonadaceae bacterium]